VVLLERDPALVAQLAASKGRLGAEAVRIERSDALQWMARAAPDAFELVLLDPPFDAPLALPAMAAAARIVVPGGFVYVEAPTAVEPAPVAAAGSSPGGHRAPEKSTFICFAGRRPAERRGYTARGSAAQGGELDFSDPTDCRVSRHLRPDDPRPRGPDASGQPAVRAADRRRRRGHHKRTMFTIAERMQIAAELSSKYPNVEVMAFRGLLRDFVVEQGAKVVVRGLRAVSDFEYEFQMAGMNRQLMPDVETVFMTPSDQYQFVSGTFVREIATLSGDVSKFVSPLVLERLQQRVKRTEV
jgi:pantetheine-phosphate adenylyltransferase